MERRINKKIENYISEFKENVKNKASELGILGKDIGLVQYMYDYERLILVKEDFQKRKRVKNAVNLSDRCCAKRANGEQCTRRRKDDCEFCGTHSKGTPNGLIQDNENSGNIAINHKMEVFAEEIKGIVYYIDNNSNVYNTEDILSEKINPRIIAKYVKDDNKYSIPEFGLV
jgi:hypothetical protein